MSKCKVKTCINDCKALGLCSKHHARYRNILKKVAGIKAKKRCVCGCNQFVPIDKKFVAGHNIKAEPLIFKKKVISVCKNPECKNEFITQAKWHFYCCEVCKESHYKSIGKTNESVKKYKKSEKCKATNKKFLQSEKGKIYRRNAVERYKEKHSLRHMARIEARKHLEDKPCSIEGCGLPGERHHEDYNRPLDVIYLCKKHHMDLHNNRLCLN